MHFRFRACLLPAVLLLLSVQLRAQADLPQDYLSKEFHKGRREAARALMPANSVLVVTAAPVRNYANDVDYIYHQNPDLYYFTGYKEPDALLFIFKDQQTGPDGRTYQELFFVQKRNPAAERWTGRRLGVEGVRETLGITEVYNGEDFAKYAPVLSKFDKVIAAEPYKDLAPEKAPGSLYQMSVAVREGTTQALDTRAFRTLTGTLREIKTAEEKELLRKAVEISCRAQTEVMKTLHADMSELEIQGLHEYIHKRYGAESVGYGSIVGSGENGCILHYMENTRTRVGNDLVLMDVGAEYHGYTADVTRTIPAKGKFGPEERVIYQLVYDAQEAAFKTLKDGARWQDASAAARDVIAEGLLKLDIIQDKKEVGRYYPHGLGHHIGLDVHDRSASAVLKKDMVITIEPGIYIPSNSPCDKKWWGLSVRIEDDALITKDGYELLSHYAPRSIADIEKMMAEKSPLDSFKLPALESGKKKRDF